MHRLVGNHSVSQIEIVNTAVLPRGRKEDVWLTAMRRACGASQVIADKGELAEGAMTSCRLGSARITLISADAQSVIRGAAGADGHCGAVHVCTPLTGALTVRQDDHQVEVRPGQVALFDSTRPFDLAMPERFRLVLVRSAHRTIGINPSHTQSLTATRWESTCGIGAVASNLFATIGRHLSELDATTIDPLSTSIRSMITSLIAERLSRNASHPPSVRQMLMIRIQTWAREHLHDHSLTPATLARRHNVSLRYLQMLFAEQDTSPARWIRDERLARCREDLTNPRYDNLTITAIGERWGLSGGASQLSRLFRERYGVPPSALRRRGQLPLVRAEAASYA